MNAEAPRGVVTSGRLNTMQQGQRLNVTTPVNVTVPVRRLRSRVRVCLQSYGVEKSPHLGIHAVWVFP